MWSLPHERNRYDIKYKRGSVRGRAGVAKSLAKAKPISVRAVVASGRCPIGGIALKTTLVRISVTTLLAFVAGCSDGGTGDPGGGGGPAEAPDMYYTGEAAAKLGAADNQATCSTCHSDDGTQAHWPGNTFKDIAYRMNFKGGMAPTLLDGSNACVVGWMGGTALKADDAAWKSLEAFMQSLSSSSVTMPNAIMPEVLDNEAAYEAAYAGGDKAAGADKFASACGRCHGGALKVNTVAAYPTATLAAFTIGRIAQKVRTSGEPPSGAMDATDTTPGPMPFFEEKDLSAQDLKDIIAFVKP
jgi:mono/diheme cytochrome c family protein